MELWCRSDIIHARMESLVKHSLLPTRTKALEWIVLGDEDETMLLDDYVISFTPFHEHRLVGPPIDSSGGYCIITRLSCST
jgi:hypothetical protein